MEAIALGSVALGLIAWAWWSERTESAPHCPELTKRSLVLPEEQAPIKRTGPVQVKGDMEMRRKSSMYSSEGKKLNDLLAQYSTGCEIHRERKVDRTPKTVVYYLAKGRGFTLGKLQASIEAIETDLYAHRELAGYDDDFSMLLMKQPLSLIAPRVDPVTLTWDKRKGKIDPCHMLVG